MLSWFWMQGIHELGHVVAGLATAARIERVVLHPLTISRTDVAGGRHPAAVVWAGPVVGSLLPVALAGCLTLLRLRIAGWCWFFGGFCLIANGAYLATAMAVPAGDAADLLRQGVPGPILGAVGSVGFAAGLWVWHRLGPGVGVDRFRRSGTWGDVACLFGLLALTLALELFLSPRH